MCCDTRHQLHTAPHYTRSLFTGAWKNTGLQKKIQDFAEREMEHEHVVKSPCPPLLQAKKQDLIIETKIEKYKRQLDEFGVLETKLEERLAKGPAVMTEAEFIQKIVGRDLEFLKKGAEDQPAAVKLGKEIFAETEKGDEGRGRERAYVLYDHAAAGAGEGQRQYERDQAKEVLMDEKGLSRMNFCRSPRYVGGTWFCVL